MKIIDDKGNEFNLLEAESSSFILEERKDIPALTLTPYKEGWNDPSSSFIQRTYKSIKIGDKYYRYYLVNS